MKQKIHRHRLKNATLVILPLIVLVSGVSSALAASHALLIGIGDYPGLSTSYQLKGPAHDVRALEGLLRSAWGVPRENIRTLLNGQATRKAILKGIEDLTAETRPDDFIFIYFSGHGSSGHDPHNKALALEPYTGALIPADFRKGTTAEMQSRLIIGSRDLQPILKKLEKGRQVLAVFDACYSGQSVRSILESPTAAKPRFVDLWGKVEYPEVGEKTTDLPPYPYRNVIYISASSRLEQALDIDPGGGDPRLQTCDGRPHGAMTDSLLRALQGGADTNHDRRISYAELYQFIRSSVTTRFCQTPQFLHAENRSLLDQPVFGRKVKTSPCLTSPDGPLRIRLDHGLENQAGALARLDGVEISDREADLFVMAGGNGYRLYAANGFLLTEAVDQNELVKKIKRRLEAKKLVGLTFPDQDFNVFLDLIGRQGVLVEKERVGFKIRTEADCYVLLLNVASNGEINVIYPAFSDELGILPAGRELSLPDIGRVVPPFGTDYLKVLAFRQRPQELERYLGVTITPEDPGYADLLALARRASAQTTLQVQTCEGKEIANH